MFDKSRFISITDAIVAVAATVMVLKLDIPEYASFQAIRDRLPILIAYFISFLQIFLDWHEHHDTFKFAEKINHRIFFVNCIWLLSITLIPFVTGMVGSSTTHTASLLIYTFVLCAEQLILIIESHMVARLNDMEMQDAAIIRKTRIITLCSYALAAISSLLLPAISLLLILAGCLTNIILIWIYDKQPAG